jgi:hypothetical protein
VTHAAWRRDGRPQDFDVDVDFAAGGVTGEDAEDHKADIDAIRKLFEPKTH